jgi:hypothetical protein
MSALARTLRLLVNAAEQNILVLRGIDLVVAAVVALHRVSTAAVQSTEGLARGGGPNARKVARGVVHLTLPFALVGIVAAAVVSINEPVARINGPQEASSTNYECNWSTGRDTRRNYERCTVHCPHQ